MPYYMYAEQNSPEGAKIKLCKCSVKDWNGLQFPEMECRHFQLVGPDTPSTFTIWVDEDALQKKWEANSIIHGLTLRWHQMWNYLPKGDAIILIPLGFTEQRARLSAQKILRDSFGVDERLASEVKNKVKKPRVQKEFDQWVAKNYSVAFDQLVPKDPKSSVDQEMSDSDSDEEEVDDSDMNTDDQDEGECSDDYEEPGDDIEDVELENLNE
jgi:hypothetical protein